MLWLSFASKNGHHYKIFFLTILITFVQSCSINGVGVGVKRHQFNQPYTKLIWTEAIGIHIYTEGVLGISIGTIERQLWYPIISQNSEYCLRPEMFNSTLFEKIKPLYSQQAFLSVIKESGLGFSIMPWLTRISVGISKHRMLRIASHETFTLQYIDNPNNPIAQVCFSVKNKIINQKG